MLARPPRSARAGDSDFCRIVCFPGTYLPGVGRGSEFVGCSKDVGAHSSPGRSRRQPSTGHDPVRWIIAGEYLAVDLNTAANELYVVAPSGFVQRRNELAAEAQRSGDKQTAAAIKRLRKPTLGAWLANLLVHECNDEIDALLHLGETLRHAQVNPTGSELRRLAEQRRRVVVALVSEARALAGKAGQAAPDGAARELETTLSAVLADDEAAAKFRSGRLTSALEYSGFGPLDHVSGRDSPDDEHSPAKKSGKKGARPTRGRLWRRRETVEQLRVAQKPRPARPRR